MPAKYPHKRRKPPAAKPAALAPAKTSGVTDRDVIHLRQKLAAVRYNDGMTVGAFVAKNADRTVALQMLYRDHKAGRISFEGRR
ncbi:hypothetical protein [Phyllobacterium endophyticum]|uniref:Uncharacterized protein n=1 Tax=Phyllobacterium endophyticum TaxID=1149773 RepID=A0A2P7ALL7_9HYPH|nr:hypothetical protein [Phyllobacterium endophyticum]MBB3236348.1 hypothetical protein [Phyllobacterium endophyticum]PSH55112.1 hypothetical protein CU100_23800 [Phyllobacterium endophyticum]TYR39885.1 hypothetical protein FY050_19890 [Phyllobacterium endophyticum]